MKSLEIKKKYEEKLKQVKAILLYEEAKELCDLISDKKLSYVINKYPKLFACISSMNEDNCWENPGCIVEAIALFRDIVDSDGLTQEEYKDMTVDDRLDYIRDIIVRNDIDIYNIIKDLESYDTRN